MAPFFNNFWHCEIFWIDYFRLKLGFLNIYSQIIFSVLYKILTLQILTILIKLLERFIKVLAAILSIEVLQGSFSSSYNNKNKQVAISFAANLLENIFKRVINCKKTSWYLRSCVNIKWVVGKTNCEYQVNLCLMKCDLFSNLNVVVENAV